MKLRLTPLRTLRVLASFDPALPEDGALIIASVLRDQFNGLKALIDNIQSVNAAQVDDTQTLPPGSAATATVAMVGGVLHFTFGIPHGYIGSQGPEGAEGPPGPAGAEGPQGPPGEVTLAELENGLNQVLYQTSNNSNSVGQMGMYVDSYYNQAQVQDIANKVDELISALRR